MKGKGAAERTAGEEADISKAVADAGNDVTALNCAKCKLDTSITNRTADNKRFDRNTAAYRKHNDRIKFERDKRAQVDKRLKEIEKSKK